MKQKLDSLFWRFAEEKFVYGGVYPYYTELVFAFADYVENAGDDELRRLLPGCRPSLLRKTVRRQMAPPPCQNHDASLIRRRLWTEIRLR